MKENSTGRCFSRKLTDAKSSVWMYGLYNSTTGERIDVKSGFPISVTLDGHVAHGYMGYYGLFFPTDVMEQLSSGMTVTRFEGNNSTNYTLQLGRGRLTKFTKKSRTLASIDQIPFQFFPQSDISGLPGEAVGKMLQGMWDNTSTSITITASVQCSESGCHTKDFSTPVSVSGSTLASQIFGGMHAFSQSLGGDLFIPKESLQDSTQNVFYRQAELVYPDDPTIQGKTFSCVNNCFTASTLSAFASDPSGASPFGSSSNNFQPTLLSSVVQYTINSSGELVNGGSAAVWTGTSDQLQGTPFMGGIRSGRLVTDIDTLQCPAGGGGTHYCDWKAEGVDTYYVWETGPNPWNRFAALLDSSNALVKFDPPLHLNYNVPNDSQQYGEFANRTIALEYSGFGQLWGIPGRCVNPRDNSNTDCSNENARYVPAFSIPDALTDSTPVAQSILTDNSNTEYLLKWLDREVRFKKINGSNCSTLTVGDTSELPSDSSLKNPSDSSSDIYIGEKPTLTSAPRVVHGVVQY